MSAIKSPIKQHNAGVAMALKVLEEGKRPMSPDQIKGKYGLEFPFTVRRVVGGNMLDNTCKCGFAESHMVVGALLTFTGLCGGDYIFGSCKCISGYNTIVPDSERFVWTGDGAIKEGSV